MARIGLFLHTPFPPSEVFRALPQRQELLRGMLGADQVCMVLDFWEGKGEEVGGEGGSRSCRNLMMLVLVLMLMRVLAMARFVGVDVDARVRVLVDAWC